MQDTAKIEAVEAALSLVVEAKPLPDGVVKFCDQIERNFSATVANLEATAKNLRELAEEFETRAKDLRTAGPDVSSQVHRWISFERESHEREKFYRTIFDK